MLLTEMAFATGVDHHADTHYLTRFKTCDVRPDTRYPTNDLVSRYQVIATDAPFIACHMQIGMADTAVKHLDLNVPALQRPDRHLT